MPASWKDGNMAGANMADRSAIQSQIYNMREGSVEGTVARWILQVRDEYRKDFDPGRGGWNKIIAGRSDL